MEHNPASGEYRLLDFPWPIIALSQAIGGSQDETLIYERDASSLVGKLPATAAAVLLAGTVMARDSILYIAHESARGTNIAGGPFLSSGATLYARSSGDSQVSNNEIFWLPVDGASPAFAWAVRIDSYVYHASLSVMGWRSLK